METNSISRRNVLPQTPINELYNCIGAIGCFRVYVMKDMVVVVDHSKPISKGRLPTVMDIDTYFHTRNGVRFRVMNYTRMASKYQGLGLAHKVYSLVAKKTGPIMSGSSQSKGARGLWYRLSKLNITVQALWKKEYHDVFRNDDDELECDEFDLYDTVHSRLVAV